MFHHWLPLLVIIVILLVWVWMLIDCITNKRLSTSEKILWLLVILFAQPIGGFIYLFIGRLLVSNSRRKQEPEMKLVYRPYQQGYQPPQELRQNYQQQEQQPHTQSQYDQPEASYPEAPQMFDR